MNIFCGCDPESLDELAERVHEGAQRVVALIELLRGAAEAVEWTGADAEDHRRRTGAMAEQGLATGGDLRAAALALRRHAVEQELASQADPLAAVRAELPGDEGPDGEGRGPERVLEDPGPWIGGPMAPADPLDPLPRLERPPGGWGPLIGGPMAPADPLDPLPGLPTPPGGWGPWIGGPFMPSTPPPPPASGPLPEGEEFALDPAVLAEAREDRELALGAVPVVGPIQTAMGVHEAAEGTVLEPVARVARLPHTVTEPLLGEDSTAGQIASTLDRGWANALQTGSEVTSALGEGDWGAAARAGERGMYRTAETSADLLTITPVPALSRTGADLLGEGADAVRPLSPDAAAGLERTEGSLREFGEGLEGAREDLTDSERWYDARRRHAPLPWDPQG
jgi:hypothetical protein